MKSTLETPLQPAVTWAFTAKSLIFVVASGDNFAGRINYESPFVYFASKS